MKFNYAETRNPEHLLAVLGDCVATGAKEECSDRLSPEWLAKAKDAQVVALICDLTLGHVNVTVPDCGVEPFIPVPVLLAANLKPRLFKRALADGVWEKAALKSAYDIREFDGAFRLRFEWNGTREMRIDPDRRDLPVEKDKSLWIVRQDAGKTKGGLPLAFEAIGTYDIFRNIRTDGPCITLAGEGLASCTVFVIVGGEIAERIDDINVLADDITLDEIVAYTDAQVEYQRRCRKQFIRNLRDWLKSHPDTVKINIDPDCGFCVEQTHKHYDTVAATVLAVGVDKDGDLFFDTETEYDYDKTVYLADVAGYGVVVTDWEWALRYLLEHFKDPYEPEDYDDDDEEDEDETCEDRRI